MGDKSTTPPPGGGGANQTPVKDVRSESFLDPVPKPDVNEPDTASEISSKSSEKFENLFLAPFSKIGASFEIQIFGRLPAQPGGRQAGVAEAEEGAEKGSNL